MLDNHTRQTLEKSLAMQIIKIVAIVAKSDKVISTKEKQYEPLAKLFGNVAH